MKIAYAVGALIWIAAMFVAAQFDLALSIWAFDRNAAWATWIQNFGTLPSGIVYLVSMLFLAVPPVSRKHPVAAMAAVAVLTMALLDPLLITTLIKTAVGRPRFVQLHGDYSLFVPFYGPAGSLSGVSFPSGHVATATVFFPAAWLLFREGMKKTGIAVAAVTGIWGIVTAAGRIVAGAHFLTDTLFSFGMAILLAPPVAAWAKWTWKRFFSGPVSSPR